MPLSAFLLGAFVKLFLTLHKISEWPRWTSFVVFLPLLIYVDNVLGVRTMIIDNFKILCAYGAIAGKNSSSNIGDDTEGYLWIEFQPFHGVENVLLYHYNFRIPPGNYLGWHADYFDVSGSTTPHWVVGWGSFFADTAVAQALIWIFLIVPITIFVYWIYEPRWSRVNRVIYWNRTVAYLTKKEYTEDAGHRVRRYSDVSNAGPFSMPAANDEEVREVKLADANTLRRPEDIV